MQVLSNVCELQKGINSQRPVLGQRPLIIGNAGISMSKSVGNTLFYKPASGAAVSVDTLSVVAPTVGTAGISTAPVRSTFVVKVMPVQQSPNFGHAITRRGSPQWRVRPNIQTQANICWYREGCGAGNDFTITGRVEGPDTERLGRLKLKVELLFEDGTPTAVTVQYHSPPTISVDGSFKIRAAIQDVSRNNQNQAFKFRISLRSETGAEMYADAASFAETEPIFVRSKPPKKKKQPEVKEEKNQANPSTTCSSSGVRHERKRSFESISPPVSAQQTRGVHPLIDRMSAESPTSAADSVTSLQAGIRAAEDAAQLAREQKRVLRERCTATIARKRQRIADLEDECKQLMQLLGSDGADGGPVTAPAAMTPTALALAHGSSATTGILHI
jgi:hypothetical protein